MCSLHFVFVKCLSCCIYWQSCSGLLVSLSKLPPVSSRLGLQLFAPYPYSAASASHPASIPLRNSGHSIQTQVEYSSSTKWVEVDGDVSMVLDACEWGGRRDATYSTLPHISCFDRLYITYTKLCDNINFLPSVLFLPLLTSVQW